MTDEIDLDEMDVGSDDGETANRGDWLWRDEGDPGEEPGGEWLSERTPPDEDDRDDETEGPDREPAPRVPRENEDGPVGIPIERGGGGGAPAGQTDFAAETDGPGNESATREGVAATGDAPHGEDADDMTMALTYAATRRLANPGAVFAEASAWTDWLGIVGDVEAHTINAFQREHGIDVDFFNGSGRGPAERLADVDARSMFYAERMVVVGVEGDERLAAEAGWEFVPLPEAAEKAGWELDAT